MPSTVLLSASLPEADAANGAPRCDPSDLRAAVTEISREILEKGGRLAFGGHPSITPLLLDVCTELRRPGALTVYQSERFRNDIPAATWSLSKGGWATLRFTASFADRELDLEVMRLAMVTEEPIAGAVFIGGKTGIAVEHELVQSLTYGVPRVTLSAPGGVAAGLSGSERAAVDTASRAYRAVARQISRAFGLR
ncbi:MAG TPA: hypothetical protein VHV75_05775 [Solirubrobacteraceae bacterium]|jgi:hypothetical protein|nr:hypothetical protein [Solirubrobacteraceae bacterium]